MKMQANLCDGLWENYALSAPKNWQRAGKGLSSETWIVETKEGEKVVLRRYLNVFTEAWMRYEHSILQHLAEHNFPVPRLIPTRHGDTFVYHEGRYHALFEYREGQTLLHPFSRKFRPHSIAAAGKTLARYHELMEGFQPEGGKTVRGNDYRQSLEELSSYREKIASRAEITVQDRSILEHVDDARSLLEEVGVQLEDKMPACSKLVIHSDFTPGNVLFRDGEVVGVLDFANAHFDARAADVAHALIGFSKWYNNRLDFNLAFRFLEAYQRCRRLTSEELSVLPHWMAFNRLKSLWWDLAQYYDEGRRNLAHRFSSNLKLARWIQSNEERLKRLIQKACS